MAGHRRGTGDPVATKKRATSRRATFVVALGSAGTPAAQVAAASLYARASVADLPAAAAAQLAAEVVTALRDLTDRALKREGRL